MTLFRLIKQPNTTISSSLTTVLTLLCYFNLGQNICTRFVPIFVYQKGKGTILSANTNARVVN